MNVQIDPQNSSYPTQPHSVIANYTGYDPYKSWVQHLDIAKANITAESLNFWLIELVKDRSLILCNSKFTACNFERTLNINPLIFISHVQWLYIR